MDIYEKAFITAAFQREARRSRNITAKQHKELRNK